MAGEYLPPRSLPFLDADGRVNKVWYEFWRGVYVKTGKATDVAPISVTGNAATATAASTATAVPPAVASSGSPVGTVASNPGTYYQDEDTGDIYYNPSGAAGDWRIL